MKLEYESPSVELVLFRSLQMLAREDMEGGGYTSIEEEVGSDDGGRRE